MLQEEINKGNVLIARFVTDEPKVLEHDLKKAGGREQFHYHDEWDWLMPVIEKIEDLGYFCMINKWTSVYTGTDGERISVTSVEGDSKITNTFIACIEFIKWYNENK